MNLKPCNFIKKRLQHRCFPVIIAKFLRTAIYRTPAVIASVRISMIASFFKIILFLNLFFPNYATIWCWLSSHQGKRITMSMFRLEVAHSLLDMKNIFFISLIHSFIRSLFWNVHGIPKNKRGRSVNLLNLNCFPISLLKT